MTDTILLVDDEPAVLKIHARLLEPLTAVAPGADAPSIAIRTVGSGMEAEAYLLEHPACAVVLSDLKMPGMDGIALLERVRTLAPDAVRIIVTGNADVHSAIEAINRTAIFRLLTKPCGGPALRTAVGDALTQYQLVVAERQLLAHTLRGSVQVMVEMLSLIDPAGSSRALRIHRYVQHVIRTLSLRDAWALEVAAMLSHLGALTLVTARPAAGAGGPETPPEETRLAHPRAGSELLKHIHRLDGVAGIIALQQDPIDPAETHVPLVDRVLTRRGGQVLRVAIEFDAATSRGVGREAALAGMRQQPMEFDWTAVDSLRDVEVPERAFEPRIEAIADLAVGMILDEDFFNRSGFLIMPRGQEITTPVLLRLRSHGSPDDHRTRVRVLAPKG